MDIKQIANRGINFFGVGFLALVSVGSLAELVMEHELNDRLDDGIIVLLAVLAIVWYNRRGDFARRSFAPGVFFILTIIAQSLGLFIEHDDASAVGPNMGFIILFVLGLVTFLWAYNKHKIID